MITKVTFIEIKFLISKFYLIWLSNFWSQKVKRLMVIRSNLT